MDSYDLFGEDVSGSMLDALPDLGGNDHFDPAGTSNSVVVSRDGPNPGVNGGGSYISQSYISQESPLQKLTSFGGSDFGSSNQLQNPSQRNMFNQNLGTFDNGAPQRAMVPGAFQNQARNMAPQHRGPHPGSGGQYPNYNDNMYSMEQQHSMTRANMSIDPSMQGWPGSGSAYPQMQRHYNLSLIHI